MGYRLNIGFSFRNKEIGHIEAYFTGIFTPIGWFLISIWFAMTVVGYIILAPIAWILVKLHIVEPLENGKSSSFHIQ